MRVVNTASCCLEHQRERAKLAAKGEAAIGQEGNHGHAQQRQCRVHGEEHDGRGQDQHDGPGNAQRGPPGQKADALHILHGTREQLAGLGAVVIAEGEFGQLGVDGVAQIVGHALGGDLGPAALQKGEHALDQRDAQQRGDTDQKSSRRLPASMPLVDDPADELGNEQREAGAGQQRHVGAQHSWPVGTQVAKTAAQNTPVVGLLFGKR